MKLFYFFGLPPTKFDSFLLWKITNLLTWKKKPLVNQHFYYKVLQRITALIFMLCMVLQYMWCLNTPVSLSIQLFEVKCMKCQKNSMYFHYIYTFQFLGWNFAILPLSKYHSTWASLVFNIIFFSIFYRKNKNILHYNIKVHSQLGFQKYI